MRVALLKGAIHEHASGFFPGNYGFLDAFSDLFGLGSSARAIRRIQIGGETAARLG
jgi:hypothetical protein